jgi:hypothetical protein
MNMVGSAIARIVIMLGLSVASVSAVDGPSTQRPLAFPGAEGFGRFAVGGRGGDVYHVTTLNDDGPGSLRQGIKSATGPRTIVFDLSGTIQLKSELRITQSCLTIAGQTAPGDGITLRDQTVSLKGCHDIILRYLRLRLGDQNKKPGGYDTLTTDDIADVILDHVSLSWAIDGTQDGDRDGMPDQWETAHSLNPNDPADGSRDHNNDGYTNLEEYLNCLIR